MLAASGANIAAPVARIAPGGAIAQLRRRIALRAIAEASDYCFRSSKKMRHATKNG